MSGSTPSCSTTSRRSAPSTSNHSSPTSTSALQRRDWRGRSAGRSAEHARKSERRAAQLEVELVEVLVIVECHDHAASSAPAFDVHGQPDGGLQSAPKRLVVGTEGGPRNGRAG